MPHKFDVACVGRVMVDFVFTDLPGPPAIGEDHEVNTYVADIGGGTAITAIALSRLEIKTAIVASIGTDLMGAYIRDTLRQQQVDLTYLSSSTSPTNVSIELSYQHDRSTVSCKALDYGAYDSAPIVFLGTADHIHVRGLNRAKADLLIAAHQQGHPTSVDAHFASVTERELFAEVSNHIDYLLINAREAARLISAESVEKAAQILGTRVGKYAVIKCGARGAVASDGRDILTSPAFPTTATDTTGAGDAFNAGLLMGILQNEPIRSCLRIANAMGALNVRKAGGTTSMPTRRELLHLLEAHV